VGGEPAVVIEDVERDARQVVEVGGVRPGELLGRGPRQAGRGHDAGRGEQRPPSEGPGRARVRVPAKDGDHPGGLLDDRGELLGVAEPDAVHEGVV
jgi:hypothetical protein